MINKICHVCRKHFTVSPSKERIKYCSYNCYWSTLKGSEPKHLRDKSHLVGNKHRIGQRPVNAFTKGMTPWNKGKKYQAVSGRNNPNWKGGVTAENEQIRKSIEYKEWRISVFERDEYTCQECGASKSNELNAEHILPFSLFPEHRFNIDNGKTLCVDCHRNTHSYLNSNMRKEDYQLIVV